MGPKLFAARYDTARTTLNEFFERPAEIRVRCALPGWLQRLEITIRAGSRIEAYERYQGHHGQGLALFDSYVNQPIVDGWIIEIIPDGRYVHYIAGGGWKRHDEHHITTVPGNEDTDAYLKNTVLTASTVPAISTDESNIDTTGTAAENAIKVDETIGNTPQELIERITRAGTSNDLPLDYWVQSQPLSGVELQAPIPYLKERSTSSSIDWQVRLRDLVDVSMSRNIWDLANDVKIYFDWYTLLNGSHTAGDTTLAVDSESNFAAGQEIEVALQSNRFHRTYVTATSAGQLTIAEGIPHNASDNALVSKINPLQDTAAATDSTSQSDYWTREWRLVEENIRGSNSDLAPVHQLRDTILDQLKDPAQRASFTVGSRSVRDNNLGRWPIWRMLQAPGYIRINDLFPAAGLLSLSLDDLRAFWTSALDYDHSTRRMRVTPDAYLGDNRLDVILQRLGAGIGQGVTV